MATESTGGSKQGGRAQAEVESLESQIETLKADIASLSATLADVVKSGVKEYAQQGRDQAEAAVDTAYAYGEALEEKIARNPFSAVLVALGLGFLVGLMSRR
jgi:ElaB/YqjD/DUF883 family membrane-anchored ribosome-binding protein